MTTLQITSIIAAILTQIIIPVAFICWVGFGKNKSKLNLILKLASVWAFLVYSYDVSMWGFLPFYIRYVTIFALIIVSIKSLRSAKALPLLENKTVWAWINTGFQIMLSALFLWLVLQEKKGNFVEEKGIDISFPLKEGYIGHGGNSPILNYHNTNPTQQYALDIGKLNDWGMRAKGFFPEQLEKYAVYGDTLFSPCNGKVVLVKDGFDNFPPGIQDNINLTGNTIVIEYDNHLILFAHLLKNSITVQTGTVVKTGQAIALIGNSGHTTEPHLHMHAVAGTDTSAVLNGNGVPIFFNGKFLTRNDRF